MVTRKDIAEKAGVSVSVVSRALNNSGYVDVNKREQILKIADELGYHPNPVAMSLMRQKTKQIIFFCKDIRNAFNMELYGGMLEAAEKRDYMVMINGSMDFQRVKGIMADGLILPNEEVAAVYLNSMGKNYYLPVVVASYGGRLTYTRSVPVIDVDLWKGALKILEYLRAKGHKKIAFASPYDFNARDARFLAWKDFVKNTYGNQIEKYFFGINRNCLKGDTRINAFSEEQPWGKSLVEENFFGKGELAAEIFKERKSDATAILCFNDEMALGFCKKFQKIGGRIPEDVSVVGIDGTYARKYNNKMLTSLAIDPGRQGSKCVEVLLDLIDGKKIKYFSEIKTGIVEGETVRNLHK